MEPPATEPSKGPQRPGYETAAAAITDLIRAGGLRPGDRLPTERALGARLGVSRTVIREAVRVLVATGLVRARQGSGLYVAGESYPFTSAALNLTLPVDPEHILSLFEFRSAVETQTARLAAERITPRELRTLEEQIALLRRVLDSSGHEETDAVDLDGKFHLGVAAATHNHFFKETVAGLFQLQRRAIRLVLSGAPGSYRVAAEQHEAIFEAIRQGQPDVAASAMHTHLYTVRMAYEQEVRKLLNSSVPAE